MSEPHLTRVEPSGSARGVVLVLHGGAVRSTRPVDHRSLSWQLMRNVVAKVAPRLHEDGIGMWLLRYEQRGWNGGRPIADARRALELLDDVPVALLGHSMGGRVAARVADDPRVRRVVALAPWWEPGDPVEPLRGRDVAAIHGLGDRITRADHTRAFLDRADRVAASTELETLPGAGHYLLRDRRAWLTFTTERLRAAFS